MLAEIDYFIEKIDKEFEFYCHDIPQLIRKTLLNYEISESDFIFVIKEQDVTKSYKTVQNNNNKILLQKETSDIFMGSHQEAAKILYNESSYSYEEAIKLISKHTHSVNDQVESITFT